MPNEPAMNIENGTVNFWVLEGMNWNDGRPRVFLDASNNGHSIFISKDSNNVLQCSHIYLGRGRTDIEYDVSGLSSSDRHMITLTWNVLTREFLLYIDGAPRGATRMSYDVSASPASMFL